MKDIFIKVPNLYIKNDIEAKFGLSKKFYIVFLLIDMHRSRAGISWLTISQVHNFYGVTNKGAKTNISCEVVSVLRYMTAHRMIDVKTDLNNIKYDSAIEIFVCQEKFEPKKDFTMIYLDMLEFITNSPTGKNRENLLVILLYMLSFIYYRDTLPYAEKETGFWRSIENTVKDTGLSKNTVRKCMDILTTPQAGRDALFFKGTLNNITVDRKMPNIFVLKEGDYKNRLLKLTNQISNSIGGNANE